MELIGREPIDILSSGDCANSMEEFERRHILKALRKDVDAGECHRSLFCAYLTFAFLEASSKKADEDGEEEGGDGGDDMDDGAEGSMEGADAKDADADDEAVSEETKPIAGEFQGGRRVNSALGNCQVRVDLPLMQMFESTVHTTYRNNCQVPIKEGTLLVFSNYQMVHRVLKLINTSTTRV